MSAYVVTAVLTFEVNADSEDHAKTLVALATLAPMPRSDCEFIASKYIADKKEDL